MTSVLTPLIESASAQRLASLLARQVDWRAGAPVPLDGSRHVYCGACRYRGDSSIAALWVADLELAGCAAAALAQIPLDVAQDCIDDAELPWNFIEYFGEILDALSAQLEAPESTPLELQRLYSPTAGLPAEVFHFARSAPERIDMHLAIEGYAGGALTLYLAEMYLA